MPDSYRPKIVSSALSDPFRVIGQKGGDSAQISRLAGIQDDISDDTICLQKFVRFSEIAAEQLQYPEFGWEVGANFDLRNIGEVGQFILEAPTLGAALSLFRKTFAMVQSDSELELKIEGDEAVLSYRILDLSIWPRRQDVELTLSIFHGLLKTVAGADWRPSLVTMEHDTSAIWKNATIGPKCQVSYKAPTNSLRFPVRLLDLSLPNVETIPFAALSQSLSHEARKREREAPVTVRVRREIIRRLGRDSLDQTEIASALGFSRRTLRRRLEVEGRSFSGILSECRTLCAVRMLHSPDTPLSQIADHLGYTEVSAFERAFRSRKGITPAQFRRLDCVGNSPAERVLE